MCARVGVGAGGNLVCSMRRWLIAAASAAVAASCAAAAGGETTLCGEGFHADPQASAKACAGAVGEAVRSKFLANLGSMKLADYQLACCAENKCVPWAESFSGTPRGYDLLFAGGDTASALGASCADGYEGEPVVVCPVSMGVFAPLRGCAPKPLPSRLHPVPVAVVAQWDGELGPKTSAALYWSAKLEIGYFLLLGMCASRVAASLVARVCECLRAPTPSPLGAGNLLYCAALAAAAGCCAFATWTEILRFIYEDIDVHGGSSAYWFAHSQVFVRAYIAVTDTLAGWWWSSQLLMFVAPLMLFFRVHALQHPGIPVLAYAFLGFLGAISVATPLLLLEVALRSRQQTGNDVPIAGMPAMPAYTAGALAASMACALLLPTALAVRAEAGLLAYKVLLIAVHVALLVAALPFGWRLCTRSAEVRSNGMLLFLAAAGALAAGSHLLNTADVVRELQQSSTGGASPGGLLLTVVSGGFPAANACQASISTDVVGTVVTVALYITAATAGVTQETRALGSDAAPAAKDCNVGRSIANALCFVAAVPLVSLCGACCALVLFREGAAAKSMDNHSTDKKSR